MSRKKIARILLVLAVVASLTLTELTPLSMVQDASAVTQADIDKLKDELSGMNSEKSQLEKELKSIQNDKSAALAQKENIDKQINLLQSEIKGVESLISEYESLITQTEQEIRENEEEEARQYEKFCERVRSMEERGTVSYWSVLFDSASFSDLLSAMDFISEIMDSDQKVIDDLRALREQIEQKKASLETSLAEQQSAKETLVAKKSELNTQRAEAEKVLAELKANEAQYKQVLSEKDAAMERQQAEIVRLSRELAEKNGNTTVTYGGYIWPCSSKYVTSPLGARYTGIAGASRNHAGIDIGRVGYTTQAVAAKAGTVIISAYNKYRGNYVVVSHGSGNTTTYQHLSSRSVSVGTYVAQGQVVGITGTTGVSSGPHLHFEITENGQIINPLKYLTEKNGARTLCGVRFDAAYASRGEGMLAALSAKRAAKYLQKRRVSYAVFPKDYPYAEVFARCGVLPPPEKPLRMAKAAEIIRRAMARLGLAPERARIALCAPSQCAALEAAARELSKDVRYLALCAPNGERLARTLRWDCGASVHTLQTDERIAADLSVCFDDFPLPDGLVLPLGSGAVSVAYGTENLGDAAMIWNEDQLICALYASLARRADEIWVKDVKMPPDGGENANLP